MRREDLEARSGSAAALLRTLVGTVLRPIGGWMSAAGAVELLAALDIPATTARSSLTRLCSSGVLRRDARDGTAGYALEPAAIPMLEQGDARIFGSRPPAEAWCLVSFSFPEQQRARRHQLRRRLAALGCGTVADGLWIGPAALEDELAVTAAEYGAELFADARPAGDLAAGLARWYDLTSIREAHEGFLTRFGALDAGALDAGSPNADATTGRAIGPADSSSRTAFALWLRVLDEWRVIPYRDPGLPAVALPSDWPGDASAALFARLRASLEPRAVAYAARTAARAPAPSPPPR